MKVGGGGIALPVLKWPFHIMYNAAPPPNGKVGVHGHDKSLARIINHPRPRPWKLKNG
jgi:hypothetical protein